MKALALVTALFFVSCSNGSTIKDGMAFESNPGSAGKKCTISFERGATFVTPAKMGMAKFKVLPQIAVWLEDTSGSYLQTIYVTKSFGKQDWKYGKPHRDTCFRPMCMPYWLNRLKASGNPIPTPGTPLPDGVTSATPTGSFTVTFSVPDSVKDVVVFAEWNSSFDNNDAFTKDSVRFNGQPSFIQSARFSPADTSNAVITLATIGHGGNKGDDATLYTDVSRLTTAPTIFSRVTIARNK